MPVSPERPGAWPEGFVRRPSDRSALLVLAHLEGTTPRDLHRLAWREGSASACLRAVRRGAAGSERDRERGSSVDPATVREALERCGARMVAPGDEEYLNRLLDLTDPPACLFVRGRALTECGPAVAIVGARRCSTYGEEAAEWLARGVAAAGVVVVSGAARGADAAAHRGALGAGRTAAVLGSGIDVPYPKRHRGLLNEIAREGSVLSEYPPGVPAERHRFPARNRIVAALGSAAVIVEGAPGSGSLITAEFAGELGREVLAVPGPITGPLSAAPHELIRDGATLVRGPDDVLEALGIAPVGGARGGAGPAPDPPEGLPWTERLVLARLSGAGATVEAVASGCGLGASEALGALAALELRGLVRGTGGRYERVGAAAAAAAQNRSAAQTSSGAALKS